MQCRQTIWEGVYRNLKHRESIIKKSYFVGLEDMKIQCFSFYISVGHWLLCWTIELKGFPGGSVVKYPPATKGTFDP